MPPPTRRPSYQAYLRVYQPVEHLPDAERRRWQAYAEQAPSRDEVLGQLHADQVRRMAGQPPELVPAAESEHALLLEQDGATYVCPVQPRLRVWRRLVQPEPAAEVLPVQAVPPALREQAAADLDRHTRSGGETRLFERTCAWQPPIAWFVPFDAGDRHLDLTGPRSLTYRTAMAPARRRTAIALRTVQDGIDDGDLVEEVEQVARWLEEFDPRSLVELDYGGLVDLLDDAHLTGDDSASDIAQGLEALAEQDTTSAAAAYRRWTSRWHRVLLLSCAS